MLDNLKKELLQIAVLAENYGLCKEKGGNFSIRDKETGYILITPSAVAREDLTEKHICVLDIDGNVIESLEGIRPSSESLMHLETYKVRDDIDSIVHTHSLYATIFAVSNKPIKPIVYEAINYGGYVYVAPYERPGTVELATGVAKLLEKNDACMLERHGLAVVGKGIKETLLKARYVEEVAEIYYKSLLLNRFEEPKTIEDEEFNSWLYPGEINL